MTRDESKEKILAQRARFIAIAMASACRGTVREPEMPSVTEDGLEVCLSIAPDDSDSNPDASPEICLAPPPPDAQADMTPEPCLKSPADAGRPQICLWAPFRQ